MENYCYNQRKNEMCRLIQLVCKKMETMTATDDFVFLLKLDRASERFQEQAKQNSPSARKMSAPSSNIIDSLNGNILARLGQRLKEQSADRELEKGCEGSNNFSDDTSGATGSFLESGENERNPYARRYFRKRQRFSAKDQSPHVLKGGR